MDSFSKDNIEYHIPKYIISKLQLKRLEKISKIEKEIDVILDKIKVDNPYIAVAVTYHFIYGLLFKLGIEEESTYFSFLTIQLLSEFSEEEIEMISEAANKYRDKQDKEILEAIEEAENMPEEKRREIEEYLNSLKEKIEQEEREKDNETS